MDSGMTCSLLCWMDSIPMLASNTMLAYNTMLASNTMLAYNTILASKAFKVTLNISQKKKKKLIKKINKLI